MVKLAAFITLQVLGNPEPAIQQAWTNEAKDKLAAFDRGEIQSAPIDELLAKMHGI